jgi:hypothetical protein
MPGKRYSVYAQDQVHSQQTILRLLRGQPAREKRSPRTLLSRIFAGASVGRTPDMADSWAKSSLNGTGSMTRLTK